MTNNRFLILLCMTAVLAVSGFNVIRVPEHSDTYFMYDLLRDLFVEGGMWRDWRFTPAPAYVPDVLVGAVLFPFVDGPRELLLLVTSAQLILLFLCGLFLAKTIDPKAETVASVLLTLFAAVTVLAGVRSAAWFFHVHNNVHVPTAVLSCLGLSLALRWFSRGNIADLILIAVVIVLGVLSGKLFLLAFIIPSVVLLLPSLIQFILNRQASRVMPALFMALTLVIGTGLGFVAERFVTFNEPFAGRAPVTMERFLMAIDYLMASIANGLNGSFALQGVIGFSLFAALWAAYRATSSQTVSVLKSFELSGPNDRLIYAQSFGVVSFLVLLSGSLASGGFADIYGARYFMLPFFVSVTCVFVTASQMKTPLNLAPIGKLVAWTLPVALIAFSLVSLWSVGTGRQQTETPDGKPPLEGRLASCLDALLERGVSLQTGVSDYWDARGPQYQMRNMRPILMVNDDLTPFFWMTTRGGYAKADKKDHMVNFAIVGHDTEAAPYLQHMVFTRDRVEPLLPPGFDRHTCADARYDILVYNDDRLDKMLRPKWRNSFAILDLRAGRKRSYAFNPSAFASQTGRLESGELVARTGDAQAFLSFGPYLSLPPGKYKACISYAYNRDVSQRASYWDVGTFDREGKTLFKAEIDPSTSEACSPDFKVETALEGFQVRIFYTGEGDLRFKDLILHKR